MRGKLKKILIPFFVVAILGYLLGWSDVLAVRTIDVTGIASSKTLTAKKVIAKSGIRIGDKLARINSGIVARELRALPEIARVDINRKPLHTVEIAITLRSIDLAIAASNGKYLLADVNGITFVEVTTPPKGVPVISGDRRFLGDAMTIYHALPKKVRKRISVISLPSRASITLSLTGGL